MVDRIKGDWEKGGWRKEKWGGRKERVKGEKGGGDGRKVPPVRPLFSLYSIILSYLFICRNQVLHGLLYENEGGGPLFV